MGKFDGVLIATDYDDTLVDRKKQVPRRTLDALDYFTREGGRFTIASGRSVVAIRPCLEGLPINAPVVVTNGTQIYDFEKEELLFEAGLSPKAPEDFREVLAEFPELAAEIYAQGTLYAVNPNTVTWEHLRITKQTAEVAPLEELPEGWIFAKLQQDTPYLQQVQEYLRSRFPGRYEAIFSNPYLLEVADSACGKGPGVLNLARLLGISPEHVYCAGDNENDLSMLKAAALSFVPEHSTPIATAAADVIVCDCDEGALADVVDYLNKKYS